MARPGIRGTFSQPGPSRPAAAVRIARTLGLTFHRHGPNGHLRQHRERRPFFNTEGPLAMRRYASDRGGIRHIDLHTPHRRELGERMELSCLLVLLGANGTRRWRGCSVAQRKDDRSSSKDRGFCGALRAGIPSNLHSCYPCQGVNRRHHTTTRLNLV